MNKAGMKNTRAKRANGEKIIGDGPKPELDEKSNIKKMKNITNIDPISVKIRKIMATNSSVFMDDRFLLEFK